MRKRVDGENRHRKARKLAIPIITNDEVSAWVAVELAA